MTKSGIAATMLMIKSSKTRQAKKKALINWNPFNRSISYEENLKI